MSQRIDLDHGRFRQIIRGKIKQHLRKYISQGEMIARKGNDKVAIPLPSVDIPHFKFGDKQSGGVGQGQGQPGDALGQGKDGKPGAGEAGDRPGEHLTDIEVSLQELAEIMSEELALPRILPKGSEKIVSLKDKYTGIRSTGPESLRHFRRTFKQALRRQISTSTYDPKNPVIVPIRDDKRYRSWKTSTEPAGQRGHHLHDGRVRLDGRRAEGDRPDRELLDRYLAALAVPRHREPLHHPRRDGEGGRPRHLLQDP